MSQSLREAAEMFQSGRLADAKRRCDVLTKTQPNNADAHYLMGLIHERDGNYEDSVECFNQVLKLDQRHLPALVNVGGILTTLGRAEEAIEPLRKALRIDSSIFPARYNLARAYNMTGELEKAAKEANKAWALNPKAAEVQFLIGEIYTAAEDAHKAIDGFRKCLEKAPDHFLAHLGLARNLHMIGEFDEGTLHVKKVLELAPDHPALHLYLCQSKRAPEEEAVSLEIFRKTLEDTEYPDAKRTDIYFVSADILDRQGNYDEAFSCYRKGNDLRAQEFPFYQEKAEELVRDVKSILTKEFFETRDGWGSDSTKPVFIVGMPRSGTTLAEQKLAAHRDVYGMGEVENFRSISQNLREDETIVRAFSELDQSTVMAFAKQTLMLTPAAGQQASRIVNKLPGNFNYLGLIAVMFPNAKIIHCRRNIMDSSFSCYQQNFKPGNLRFANKLEELGLVARQYLDVMDHYRDVLPIDMFELDYENMVADPDYWTNAMYEYIGVDATKVEDSSITPAQAVRTASVWQVRQPVYTSSIDKWRRYESHLAGLAQVIGVDNSAN